MYLRFEIFVVVDGNKNVMVTTVFNDALDLYLRSEGSVRIEVWDEGVCIETYTTLDDIVKAERILGK